MAKIDYSQYNFHNFPLELVKGITPTNLAHFNKLKIVDLPTLLMHLPRNYEDRSRSYLLSEVILGNKVLVRLKVISRYKKLHGAHGPRRNNDTVIFTCEDEEGSPCTITYFNAAHYFDKKVKDGEIYNFYGQVKLAMGGIQANNFVMIHPEIIEENDAKKLTSEDSLTPIYPMTKGLRQNTIRKVMASGLEIAQKLGFEELVPADGYPSVFITTNDNDIHSPRQGENLNINSLNLLDSISKLHHPPLGMKAEEIRQGRSPWLVRVTAEEILAKQLSLLQAKYHFRARKSLLIPPPSPLVEKILANLPFQLTAGQNKAYQDIVKDLAAGKPMMRLIQGDVGCGKSMVATLAVAKVVEAGYQVALMAPTEILASQLEQGLRETLEPLGVTVVGVNGRLGVKAKREIGGAIASGQAQVIVGTHAIYSDWVQYHNLGMVIIDEQHRFGVEQRLIIQKKQPNFQVHFLMMSATPAPRSLAMTLYADLDLSIISDLPPGRQPVTTTLFNENRKAELYQRIRARIKDHGDQVYWVCMLIEENDNYEAESVYAAINQLKEALPDIRIGLIHGKMKDSEKADIMYAFKNHQLDMIVATTVIEVGVNVPNATIMVIQNPEKLGLSQIHQLRGRVGRGTKASFCILLYGANIKQNTKDRLAIFTRTTDGFVIAEEDMKNRGTGDIVGTAQSGEMDFLISDLVRDAEIANAISTIAEKVYNEEPDLSKKLIERWARDKQDLAGA